MKKLIYFLLLIIVLFIGVGCAHPWNTSWDGCHYCKTNCTKRGYTYNTRHCHNWWVPQFGVADPLYYSSTPKEKPLTQDQLCDQKYSWTVYRKSDGRCACNWDKKWISSWNSSTKSCLK